MAGGKRGLQGIVAIAQAVQMSYVGEDAGEHRAFEQERRRRYQSPNATFTKRTGRAISATAVTFLDRPIAGQPPGSPDSKPSQLDRLRLRGPNGAKDEFLLAATAQNLRKLAKLIPETRHIRCPPDEGRPSRRSAPSYPKRTSSTQSAQSSRGWSWPKAVRQLLGAQRHSGRSVNELRTGVQEPRLRS